jgi:hypothetical protein
MGEILFNVLSKEDFLKQLTSPNYNRVVNLLSTLKDNLTFVSENPYIDKVFRDSYYTYFASKHQSMERDCIRISIFEGKLNEEDFFSRDKKDWVQSAYLGFFVIRPTKGKSLGRSLISPKAFKEQNFLTCLVKVNTQLFGIPLEVHAFPHSSQDSHTITCAETTIWAIMEYFGNRYPEYKPTLPSEITKVLSTSYTHRVYPSEGLTAIQISKALKEFNFGVVMYSYKTKAKDQKDLFNTIATYVESGIPVILAVGTENDLGHAVIVCGHEDLNFSDERDVETALEDCEPLLINGSHIFETTSIQKRFLFIDDNRPQYRLEHLKKPLVNYPDTRFHSGFIKNLIVPLYSKIYLDERKAQALFTQILTNSEFGLGKNFQAAPQKMTRRVFLTSSRSYKKFVFENLSYSDLNKRILLSLSLPKFIWICELSSFGNYQKGKVDAQILLDATGNQDLSSLVLAQYPNTTFKMNQAQKHGLKKTIVDFSLVDIYRNNLKGAWNQWKA